MAGVPQPSPTSTNDIKLSLLRKFNIPKSGIYRGCIIHWSGKLILTDCAGSKLIILNDDDNVDTDIHCSSYVNDVTTIDDTTVAVSTDNGIDIINIDSKQTEKVIKTSNLCYGITHNNGTLLWCEYLKGIQRMNLSDGCITTLVKQDQLLRFSYITTYGDKIYQTSCNTKSVTCYINGERLWEYKNESVLPDPFGITVGSNGTIFVASCSSHHVVVVTADGKEGRQLLGRENGISHPWGIYYDKTNDNVLVVNSKGPVCLYHISQCGFHVN